MVRPSRWIVVTLATLAVAAAGCGRKAPASAIVKGLTEVEHVKIDADHVYWRGHNAVLRAKKDGSETQSMFQAELTDFTLDTAALYFTSESSGIVASFPLAPGGVQTTLARKITKPSRITSDFVFLYVCNRDEAGQILKVAKQGAGTPQVLADKVSEPQAIAVDTNDVFFGTNNGQLLKVAKTGGAVTKLDADTSDISDVVVDDTSAYWVSHYGPSVKLLKVPKNGGPRTVLATFDGASPRLAMSGALLFVAAEVEGGKVEVLKITNDGKGKLTRVGSAKGDSAGVAVDSTFAFAGVRDPKGDDGWIIKLPR